MATGPEPAWSGSEYAVAWNDDRSGDGEVYFARLSPSGERIGLDARLTYCYPGTRVASMVLASDSRGTAWRQVCLNCEL